MESARNSKSTRSQLFILAMAAFVARVGKHIAKTVDEGAEAIAKVVAVEPGRKFDKVLIVTLTKHRKNQGEFKTEVEARYFVEVETGNIYGAKSPLAPNTNRYFGKVENASKWDWSGLGGVNKSDATVMETGGYGGVKHYVEVPEGEEAPSSKEPVTA